MADYRSTLTGTQMDSALLDMAEHNSEAYAVGERNGIAVASDDVTYHNNARYYAQIASSQIVGDASSAVRWDTDQSEALTDAQKAVARNNINAASDSDVVKITAQTLTSAQQAQARANIMAGGSNRNLLDNPFFQVNQRSFTTSTGNTYTVDRWIKSGNATVTLSNGIIVFDASSATSSYNFFSQRLAQDLTGRTVTLSLMTDDGTIYSKSGEIPARTSSAQTAISLNISAGVFLEFTVSASSAAYTASIDVVLRNGRGPLNIKAVKLEIGSVSTLANDAPPDYGTELLKCQYYAAPLEYTTYSNPFTGLATSATEFFVEAYLPRSMREISNPTISVTGTAYAIRNGSTGAITAWDAGAIKGNHIRLKGTTTNLTANTQVPVYTAGNTLKIFVSADL